MSGMFVAKELVSGLAPKRFNMALTATMPSWITSEGSIATQNVIATKSGLSVKLVKVALNPSRLRMETK
jgi:hypothetical protein